MNMLEQLITSFVSTAAFAILFNVPRSTIVQCGFVGMVGWLLYISLQRVSLDAIVATLIASFIVTVISQLLARIYKTPVIVFSVAGIIPLVPGGLAYDAMRNVVLNHYDVAVQLAAKAFMLSGAIAMGLVFSEVLNQLVRRKKA
ncbi:threonine/serine exporter family protein [Paenibacillus sp. GCM10023248]|uniref:threonine/serine exporter family protein n=1 Tax=Bacillales TaxID=1385 RepID=UPI002377F934|nr:MULTISPECIES: threonine/serine exporter family protein [Bacillales]MDD9268005.1 threonine/serine exporter family protein [Paenibacillus sp. MAHUQ-63]MDR6879677.1 uncharacterized membrane protein YjjB (DUF3815 family) [Bacillus sp. 3255]